MATILTPGRVLHPARCACAATSPKPEIAPRSIMPASAASLGAGGRSEVSLGQPFEFRRVLVRAERARDERNHKAANAERRVPAEFVLSCGTLVTERAHDREIEPAVVAAGLVALLAQFAGCPFHLVYANPDRAPSVAPLGDAPQRVLVAAAEQHRRSGRLRGSRVGADRRKLDVFSLERRVTLGPQRAHRGDILGGLGPAMGKVAAEQFGFLAQPTGADTEDEAAAGEMIETANLFGQDHRVVLGHQADAGGKL